MHDNFRGFIILLASFDGKSHFGKDIIYPTSRCNHGPNIQDFMFIITSTSGYTPFTHFPFDLGFFQEILKALIPRIVILDPCFILCFVTNGICSGRRLRHWQTPAHYFNGLDLMMQSIKNFLCN